MSEITFSFLNHIIHGLLSPLKTNNTSIGVKSKNRGYFQKVKKLIAEFSLSCRLSFIFHSTSTHTSVCTHTNIRLVRISGGDYIFYFCGEANLLFASIPFWSDLNLESIEIHTFALKAYVNRSSEKNIHTSTFESFVLASID